MSVHWRVRDEALFEAIEWHLLRSQLTPAQVRCLDRHGWFEVVWRPQWLVLRVYADRFPTVDAHQLEVQAGYLCSFDVRSATASADDGAHLSTYSHTPAGCARRVVEAHRRGALKKFLESSGRLQLTR